MTKFFTFLQTYRAGVLLFLLILIVSVFLTQWLAWIFARGRFRRSGSGVGTGTGDGSSKTAGFVLADFLVKIINEFRHLLALLVLVIFAFALAFSLIKAGSLSTGDAVSNMKGAIEGVVATLGGLVGSIIGYYFGESSITKPGDLKPDGSPQAVQSPPAKDAAGKAPAPPGAPQGTSTESSSPGGSTGT
jgi:hypothetical protein